MAKKSCKKGYYYCNTDKKCKKIPKGWHVMPATGYLMRDSEHKNEDKEETNGKKKNGNGNGSNGNGNGNGGSDGGSNGGGVSEAWSAKYKKSIDCDNPKGFSQRAHCRGREKVSEAKNGDHEVAMAQSQLKKSARNIAKLRKALGKKEKDIPAWMQAKITDTAHDTDAAAGYADKMDEEVIAEKRDGKSAKSKGYSLRDWFKGGGWVQAGGKYDGKPCAKQPGQKTKPFCRDADDRANMSKKERSRRAAKKRREDPNPNRKGKAKMVSASYSNWKAELQLDEGAAAAIRLGLAAGTAIGGAVIGKKAHDAIKGMTDRRNKRLDDALKKARGIGEGYDEIRSYDRIKRLDGRVRSFDDDKRDKNKKAKPTVQLDKAHFEPQGDLVDEGKKDACYHKVKSRYSVWPSAYASGALVKCRKVGAKNWGNKTKKESYEFSNWRDDFQATEYESVDIIKAEPLQPTQGVGSDMLDEKKRLMNKLDKISGQLRKASAMHKKQSQEVAKVSQHLCAKEVKHEEFGYGETIFGEHAAPDENGFVSHYNVQFEHGIVENVSIEDVEVLTLTEHENHEMDGDLISEGGKKCWKGYKKAGTQKLFGKTYNRCVKAHFSDWRADMELQEDWQKSNRKDGVDGMSQKSVNAYKRENPGSKLQTAVTGKNPTGKDKKRRKSFCARSNGQRKMHNIDCSKTPDKKICKARKRWRC